MEVVVSICLLLVSMVPLVCPSSSEDCGHWNATDVPLVAATPLDHLTSSVVDTGE